MYVNLDKDASDNSLNLKNVFRIKEVPLNHPSATAKGTSHTILATDHNSRSSYSILYFSNCITVQSSVTPNPARTPPLRQQHDIVNFSRSSRKQMIDKLARLNFLCYSQMFMCTLTYRHEFPLTQEEQKKHIDRLQKKFRQLSSKFDFIWRIETQKRGAPHLHYLLLFKDRNRTWSEAELTLSLRKLWRSVIPEWSSAQDLYAVHVKSLSNVRKSLAYMTKYIAKEDPTVKDTLTGRRWGTSTHLDLSPYAIQKYSKSFITHFRFCLLKYLRSKLTVGEAWESAILRSKSITVLLSVAEQRDVYLFACRTFETYCLKCT